MKKIAITGLSGVIGSVLVEEISKKNQVIDLFNKKQYKGPVRIAKHAHLDLLNKDKIDSVLKTIKPDVIIHMAAVTHIDRCEKDKKLGVRGKTWKINVEGTGEIAKFCAEHKIPLVFLSTECVFDGKQKYFSESSTKNPINWYGETKSEAENLILLSKAPAAIIRSVVAYHKEDARKTIYGKILSELKKKRKISVVHDQVFTPTWTKDIVRAINLIVEQGLLGIYHVAPKKELSPYEFALLIAGRNKYSHKLVKKTTLRSYYDSKRANLRLRHACLSGKKTNRILKFTPSSPESVI